MLAITHSVEAGPDRQSIAGSHGLSELYDVCDHSSLVLSGDVQQWISLLHLLAAFDRIDRRPLFEESISSCHHFNHHG